MLALNRSAPSGLSSGLVSLPGVGSSPASSRPVLGTAQVKGHAQDKVVETKAWGTVPINQMGIVLKDGLKRSDADAVAKTLGGTVVGEVAYVSLYQLEIPTKTEAELEAAIKKAKGTSGVELAFPNQAMELWADIKGVSCSALNDPVYSGTNGSSYQMIGVQNAWDILKASGATLNEVHVGVTDDGLYKGNDEFDGGVKVNAEGSDDKAAWPDNGSDGKPKPYGTHGTAVTGIIAANPDNGGMAGIASPLGSKMQITHTSVFGQKYGGKTLVEPDPDDADDPTQYVSGGQTFSIGPLVALKEQIEKGATVINCSWGTNHRDQNGNYIEGNADLAQAYRKFFEKMARDNPKVVFVVAAGNDGTATKGSGHWPGGAPLPNMITVGNLDGDGTRWKTSNMNGEDFEVTLGAPGHRVVAGVSEDGRVQNEYGGTSFASPQVAATVAMLKSLNPELEAADIKKILVETAATETDVSGKKVQIDASVGGRVLRVDNAVLKVLKELKKVPANATVESLRKLGTIDAVASSSKPLEYTVKAMVGAVGEKGTDVRIELWGEGSIGGNSSKRLDKAGEVSWSVTLLKADSKPSVRVTRMDNNACSIVHIAPLSGNAASTQQQSGKGQPELLAASQKAVVEDLEIALLSAKATKEYINGPKAGNKYIVLRFRTKNIGKEAVSGDVSSNLQWLDKDSGRRNGPVRTTGIKLDNPKDSKLAPGAESEFEREYEVPESLGEVEFHYLPGYNPIEKARWRLGIQ